VAPLRQQTLRATLDWSYGLLEEPDKVLLERLTVFAGGWTLKAAQVVCAGADLESERILDALARLSKSRLPSATEAGPVRRAIECGALRYFWFFQGHLTEGRAWLAELAAMPDSGTPSVERARVLAGASILAAQQGNYETTRSLARQAEMLWNQLGNEVERRAGIRRG
jgi:predicted ATPase